MDGDLVHIVHPVVLKHTMFIDSLFQAQILACLAGTNCTPLADLHPCGRSETTTDAREKIYSSRGSVRIFFLSAAAAVCSPESGEGKTSVPAPLRPPALAAAPLRIAGGSPRRRGSRVLRVGSLRSWKGTAGALSFCTCGTRQI